VCCNEGNYFGGEGGGAAAESVYIDQAPELYCLTMYATYNKYNQSDKLSWLLVCTEIINNHKMLCANLNKLDNTIFCKVNNKIQNVPKGVNGMPNGSPT
jgi:hypothetical protein